MGEGLVEYVEFGEVGQMGEMIAQHAGVECRLEGRPSQVLRRRMIAHRRENPDFQMHARHVGPLART